MSNPSTTTWPTLWDEVREIHAARPPFTSVYLPVDRAREDAAHQLDLRWRHARERLEAEGTPADELDRLGEALRAETHGATVGAIADSDGALWVRPLFEPVPVPVARRGALPHVVPLLAMAQASPPYLVVLVDRRGADLISVVDGSEIVADESVEGDPSAPIRKVAAGGWSQRRFQQRAENTWDENAAAVAEEVGVAASRLGAVLVIAAGDERAVTLLQDHLPAEVAPLLRVIDTGGRAVDGSADDLQREVERVVATEVARTTAEELRRFVELRERRAVVADGMGATFAALREALVDEVLLHADPDDERTAWFDPSAPTLVADEARTLRDLGVEPIEAPLADVVVWSSAGTGASLRLVPGAGPNVPTGGLGAFLRGPVATDA